MISEPNARRPVHQMNQGVSSKTLCNSNGSCCRRNAAVKYAMLLAYLIVIGSPVKASVDAQFGFAQVGLALP